MGAVPFIIVLIGALVGAGSVAYAFHHFRLRTVFGAGVGALVGALGALLFVWPLEFCMFVLTPEARYTIEAIDQAFGVFLVALGMTITISSTIAFVRWWVQRNDPANRIAQAQQPGHFKGWLMPLVLLAPTIIILALFLYYPSLDTLRLSTLLARLGAPRTAFICVDNFTELLVDPEYFNSIFITFFIGIAVVVFSMGLALLIAYMAYRPLRGAQIYRTLLIWPYAISPAVAGIIFVLMFNPAGGIINRFLDSVFGFQIGWLNDPNAAPWTIIIASVWKSVGFNILFYIAGLQNVPKDLQEAASIDGANAWQRFWRVTWPLLGPITFFLVITNLTYAFFETFATIDFITGGGPLGSTTTLMYRVYEVGVAQNQLGRGAAQSIVLFLMVIGLTLIQFRTQENRR
jgi:sn-glycerol 3-phosphate transport system permease protein